jgi:polygalacturonase
MKRDLLCLLLMTFAAVAPATAAVQPDPLPSIYARSATYSLRVDGVDVPVTSFSGEYDYACLSADGPCGLEITDHAPDEAKAWAVSPLKFDIHPAVAGRTIRLRLDRPQYLIASAPKRKKLVIAVDPIDARAPARDGAGVIDVTTAGADPTGAHSSTAALQAAIDKSAAAKGTAYVPAGVYAITNLTLPSNAALYLAPGSVLRATGPTADFRVDFRKNSQKHNGTWLVATAQDSHDVRVFGRGTIDGDGRRYSKDEKFGNHLLVPITCRGFTVDGIVLRDAASWGTVPARSQDVTVSNCKLFNGLSIGEDDGIDVCECDHVRVTHTIGIALDDPFSTKTWAGGGGTDLTMKWYGQPHPNHDIVFDDCLSWTYCFAYKIGAGVCQPQGDITIRDCVAFDCAHGFGISHEYGTEAVTGVTVDGLDVEHVGNKNIGRSWALMFIKGGGTINDITMRNITVRDRGTTPFDIHGIDAANGVHGVHFEDIRMPNGVARSASDLGVDAKFADGITVAP